MATSEKRAVLIGIGFHINRDQPDFRAGSGFVVHRNLSYLRICWMLELEVGGKDCSQAVSSDQHTHLSFFLVDLCRGSDISQLSDG